MSTHRDDRKELGKALRVSRRMLPAGFVLAVVAGVLLWAATRYLGLPVWVAWVVFAFAAVGAVGDLINVIYVRRKLRSNAQ
jgi:hypothetical protein